MTGRPAAPSKADLVYRRLKTEIEAGALPPGSPLAELALVARTGASRTPVREALRRLAAEGLVDLVPRRGARVSRVSPRSVRDLFDLRSLLEPEAVRQATTAVAGDPALRRTVTRMRAEFERLRRRRPSPARSAAFYALADRFDWLVIDATANEHLRRTIGDLRPHTARLRDLSHTDPGRIETSVVEHLRMVDAILAGEADRAAVACADHLAAGLRTIFRALATGTDEGLDVLAQ